MVRIRNEANDTTLFSFNSTTKIIKNTESMLENFEFNTEIKKRHGLKAIIKRIAGITNKQLHLKVVLSGASRDTDTTTLMGVLNDEEFIYLDTESFQTRLDGIYGFVGSASQKRDQHKRIITIEFDIIEKEDDT